VDISYIRNSELTRQILFRAQGAKVITIASSNTP
jgi:hypothetical protein